jgi:hypothetical protein
LVNFLEKGPMTRPEAERATGWPQSGGGAEFWSLDAVQWLGREDADATLGIPLFIYLFIGDVG